jgi:CRISPR/Cas system-associated exonuclease Cas4 (RecB family)
MIDLHDMVTKSLEAYDSSRDRSKQVEIGPSSIGGCSRRVWHDLVQSPKINETEKLAAILGTFIHTGFEEIMLRNDPFGDNYLQEIEVSHGDLRGHCDLFIKDEGLVVDWKTIKKNGLRYFGSQQQRYQIHVYGWLLEKNGFAVKEVALVGIPRDGKMEDIAVFREAYDPAIAEEGIAWLDNIKQIVADGSPAPAPEKRATFCKDYCPYFDAKGEQGCPSMTK